MHDQDIAIVKGLVSVAWADGRIAAEEHEVIDALLQAYSATPSENREILRFAETEKTIDDIPINDLSHDDRRVLLQHAVLLTFIDGEQHEKEKEILDQLCERLRIPDVEGRGIIAAAERRAREMLEKL
jgi:tellurite resistance protein